MKTYTSLCFVCVCILGGVFGQDTQTVDICSLPIDTGKCRAGFTRFHYNPKTTHCEEFIYGGCGGNLNNFETIFECRKKCGQTMPSQKVGVVIPAI